jgi:hypothetical protein
MIRRPETPTDRAPPRTRSADNGVRALQPRAPTALRPLAPGRDGRARSRPAAAKREVDASMFDLDIAGFVNGNRDCA